MSNKMLSGLASIDVKTENPFELFQEWLKEASTHLPKANTLNVMNLATSTKDGCVSNRNVLILKYESDGFVFLTDAYSRKSKEINENPNVAGTFLWRYNNKIDQIVTRQIRVYGKLEKMSSEVTNEIYESVPIFRKIRYYVCEQGKEIDPEEMRKKHDEILKEVENGRKLEMPPHAVSYKLIPDGIEFYYDYDNYSADRVLFRKEGRGWTHVHISS